MSKVSVIMPVYNGRAYIEASIASIQKQSFGDVEFIAVNDGSTDDSLDVLEKIKERNESPISITIVNQKNQGISASRNAGLAAATSEFIMFIDQDDYYDPDAIEVLYDRIVRDGSDVAIASFRQVTPEGGIISEWKLDANKAWSKFSITTPWARIYRKSLIDQNHITFMDTKISEDFYFNYVFLSYAPKVSIMERCVYNWVFYKSSESHSKWNVIDESRNPLKMLDKLCKDMNPDSYLEPELIEYAILKHVIWYLFYVAKNSERKAFKEVYRRCMAWLDQTLPDHSRNGFRKRKIPDGENRKIRLIVRLSVFLKKIRLLFPVLRVYSHL